MRTNVLQWVVILQLAIKHLPNGAFAVHVLTTVNIWLLLRCGDVCTLQDKTRKSGKNRMKYLNIDCGTGTQVYGMVWYGMVDVYDGYLAAEASGSSFG